MIPPLCATLGPVLAGPEGCSRGRWRSGPSKWRHTAAPEGRGQGAPRTCRCIETQGELFSRRAYARVREHHAPVGALRHIHPLPRNLRHGVREHHAPVGALRPEAVDREDPQSQVREHHAPVGALRHDPDTGIPGIQQRQGAPRTCKCIETGHRSRGRRPADRQGAPRTCRCIETSPPRNCTRCL